MNKAFITGVTGQDGAYLSRFLLEKGYEVHGMQPRCEVDNTERLADILSHPRFFLHAGDLTDGGNVFRLLHEVQPDEIYNLGAQSHVATSFQIPEQTANVDALGVLRLLEAIRTLNLGAKFYQASSSELFGNAPAPQHEKTPFQPCSPYAAAKLYAYWMVRTYRESYGIFAVNGILFNHESPLRGEDFVTRKVTKAVAEIYCGLKTHITLGNLDAVRDWGHARDYVEGMWLMLQQSEPQDYILATGQTHSVRQLVEIAFAEIGREIVWRGMGPDEVGYERKTGDILVKIDPQFYRPNDVHFLCGDATKAYEDLGWTPKTSFRSLIQEMLHSDLAQVERSKHMDHLKEKNERVFRHAA
ncbi:MAG: GDP-mannose 4,6-dehydratase [Rhodospirillales bacterium]|nr:GDP-mannose 4,6-dehydratase [Rhodospirillales bacterium]MCB9964515.1 GDP-mannose 4,6-dehydratase [Rhodospirillales bacterium]MCB9973788.1 GDP-mannose 4,6-dehydratase [Rhodospirillales bacterium]MCB9980328.1 GDP-mannose 4,6-dehydratase [Rhodospirillales bacterium]